MFTYVPSTDRGKVRLLCYDTDVAVEANQIFTDDEIDTFLELAGGSVYLAAAEALNVIGTSHVLVLKVMSILDVTVDGAKMSAELRAKADRYRARHDETVEADDTDLPVTAELVVDAWTYRDHLRNEVLRAG